MFIFFDDLHEFLVLFKSLLCFISKELFYMNQLFYLNLYPNLQISAQVL